MTMLHSPSSASDSSANGCDNTNLPSTSVRMGLNATRQRPAQTPGGPRRPSVKPSMTNLLQQRQLNGGRGTSELPPSYVQSQTELQVQGQSQQPLPFRLPPPPAVLDSSTISASTDADNFTEYPASLSMSPNPAPAMEQRSSPVANPIASPTNPASRVSAASTHSPTTARTVSTPSTPTPSTPTYSAGRLTPAPTSANLTPLPAPPPVSFVPALLPYKPLTLDAAQWTFSSSELQAIVSRAIRASAEPSSIRLLPLQTLDEDIGEEIKRLEDARDKAQAEYRFAIQRKMMLLHSLNALPQISAGASSRPVSPSPSLPQSSSSLVHNLAQTCNTLTSLTLTLLHTSAHLSQLRSLQDVHAGSALAVALRKLNTSYARRMHEVATLKERVKALEQERDEGWRVAEEMAKEVDELKKELEGVGDEDWEDDDFEDLTEEVVHGARAVAAPATLTRASRIGMPSVQLRVPAVTPGITKRSSVSDHTSTSREIAANESGGSEEVSPKIPFPSSENGGAENAEGCSPKDNQMIGSTALSQSVEDAEASSTETRPVFASSSQMLTTPVSTTSPLTDSVVAPARPRSNSAASRVSAARKRSLRASKASLRLPRALTPTPRPPSVHSTFSIHSGHSIRSRSRGRALSRAGSRAASTPVSPIERPPLPIPPTTSALQSPSSASPCESVQLPDVSKSKTYVVPELKASAGHQDIPIPSVPTPRKRSKKFKARSAAEKGSSFLDLFDVDTRPNSSIDLDNKKQKDSVNTVQGAETMSSAENEESQKGVEIRRSGSKRVNEADNVTMASPRGSATKTMEDVKDVTSAVVVEGDNQIVSVPPSLSILTHPFSAPVPFSGQSSRNPSNLAYSAQLRVPSHPPPDSPSDIDPNHPYSLSSDDLDIDDDDDDLVDAELTFMDRYSLQSASIRGRARLHHTQSLLPVPVSRPPTTDPQQKVRSYDGGMNGNKHGYGYGLGYLDTAHHSHTHGRSSSAYSAMTFGSKADAGSVSSSRPGEAHTSKRLKSPYSPQSPVSVSSLPYLRQSSKASSPASITATQAGAWFDSGDGTGSVGKSYRVDTDAESQISGVSGKSRPSSLPTPILASTTPSVRWEYF